MLRFGSLASIPRCELALQCTAAGSGAVKGSMGSRAAPPRWRQGQQGTEQFSTLLSFGLHFLLYNKRIGDRTVALNPKDVGKVIWEQVFKKQPCWVRKS